MALAVSAPEPNIITISGDVAQARGSGNAADFYPGRGQSDTFPFAFQNALASPLPQWILWGRVPEKQVWIVWDGSLLIASLRTAADAQLARNAQITVAVLPIQSIVPIELFTTDYTYWRSIPVDAVGANPASQRNTNYNADLHMNIGFNAIFDEGERLLFMVQDPVNAFSWAGANSQLEVKVQQMTRAEYAAMRIPNSKFAREAKKGNK